MPTKAQLKVKTPVKLKVRRGDQVVIISGKDKGEIGHIYAVDPQKQKVLVLKKDDTNDGQLLPLNAAIKHKKARYQGERSARIKIPVPIHVSNVMLIDPANSQPTRVGRRKDDTTGKLVRYGKKSGQNIPEPDVNFGRE